MRSFGVVFIIVGLFDSTWLRCEQGLPSEIIADPFVAVTEFLAHGPNHHSLEKYIIENPENHRAALLRYASQDLEPLRQLRLVNIAFYVLDDVTFRREAEELLSDLEMAPQEDQLVNEMKENIKAMISARFGETNSRGRADLRESKELVNLDTYSETKDEEIRRSRDSPKWTLFLIVPAVLSILFLLVRAYMRNRAP